MCEVCNNTKLLHGRVLIRNKTYVRNIEGKIEPVPCFSEVAVPLNYCPNCGRKL